MKSKIKIGSLLVMLLMALQGYSQMFHADEFYRELNAERRKCGTQTLDCTCIEDTSIAIWNCNVSIGNQFMRDYEISYCPQTDSTAEKKIKEKITTYRAVYGLDGTT